MKAAYYSGNQQFTIEEGQIIPPGPDEVRVSVNYCGICGTDMHVYHGAMDTRVTTHRVIGHEMSGTVAELGNNVAGFSVGEPVVVRPLVPCGECPACSSGHTHICQNLKFLGLDTDGAFQQFWTVPSHTLHKLPASMNMRHAALVEPVAVACHDVRRSRLQPGEDVLVIGGGPIGMLIALVAKDAGANVTLSEPGKFRRELAERLGFATLDPRVANVGEAIHALTNNKGADVVFEVSGTQPGVDAMTEAVAVRGRIVMVAIHAQKQVVDLFRFFWREIEMLGARVYEPEDYDQAISLLAKGAIHCDQIITGIASLDDIGQAFAELDGDARAMKTLIECQPETA